MSPASPPREYCRKWRSSLSTPAHESLPVGGVPEYSLECLLVLNADRLESLCLLLRCHGCILGDLRTPRVQAFLHVVQWLDRFAVQSVLHGHELCLFVERVFSGHVLREVLGRE